LRIRRGPHRSCCVCCITPRWSLASLFSHQRGDTLPPSLQRRKKKKKLFSNIYNILEKIYTIYCIFIFFISQQQKEKKSFFFFELLGDVIRWHCVVQHPHSPSNNAGQYIESSLRLIYIYYEMEFCRVCNQMTSWGNHFFSRAHLNKMCITGLDTIFSRWILYSFDRILIWI
jgi:hypothetical protein